MYFFRLTGAKKTIGKLPVARAAKTATAIPSVQPPRLATSSPDNAPASLDSAVVVATDARRTTGATPGSSVIPATVTLWVRRATSVTTRLENVSVCKV